MGWDSVYPALDKIPKAKLEDRIAAKGSANCWNYLVTSLATSGRSNRITITTRADLYFTSLVELAMGTKWRTTELRRGYHTSHHKSSLFH